MNSYTRTVSVARLTGLIVLFLLGNSYVYAQLTASNVCPSTTVDLTTHVTGTPPAGAVVTWHTGTPATTANRVADPTKVSAGVYYAAYYDATGQCYGNTTSSLTVSITACAPVNNICPATTVDLTTHVSGTPPAGSVITWHTGTPATAANRIADPTQVGNGQYYAAYFDPSTSCYGNTTSPLSVSIVPCPTPSPDNGTVVVGIGGTAINSVVANDLIGGQPATLGAGGNATVATVGTYPTGIALNTGTGAVTVSATVPPGIYTVVYQLCNTVSTPACATTTATITVTPSVTASPDAGTVTTGNGGAAIASVTTNDVVNGQPATLGTGGNATVATVGTYPAGITLNPATGSVSVAAGTSPGSYTVVYRLCDRLATPTCTTTTAVVTVLGPDLIVSIGQPSPALSVGQTSTVPVSLSNVGLAATAGPVTFTLSIPSSVTAPSTFTNNGFTCTTSGTLVACTSSVAITNGASTTVLVPITPLVAAAGTSPVLSATAATGNESNPNNNTTTTTVTPAVVAPDLIVSIGQPAPVLVAGQSSSVPVTINNIGTTSTTGPVTFTLSIPASVTAPATFTSNGFSCTTSGTLVTCTSSATITNGAGITVQVPITPLNAAVGTSPILSATVLTAFESNVNNNTATVTATPVAGQPDLIVAVGQPAPVLSVGQTSSVPVSLSNIGTAATSGPVTFTLSIPSSVTAPATFVSNGFSCSTSGTLVACSSPVAITNGASTTVLVPITPLAAAAGTSPVLSATAATGNESNPNNNTTTVTATPVKAPDLTVSIGQPAPVLVAGQSSSVPVTINNIGTAPTTGPVTFTLSIPASVTAPATFVSNGFTCSTSGTLVSCTSSATITNGTSSTLAIPITPLNAAVGTSPVLSATVATAFESNVNNNTATVTATPVAGQPDLIVAVGQPAPVLSVGQTSSVPVSLSNIGTAATSGPVTFTLSIPASVTAPATFVSNGFSCSTSGTLVACTSSATITNGASTTVLVPITPLAAAAGTSPVLSATAATGNESNNNNNTTTTTVTPAVAAPDVTILIGQASPALSVGQPSTIPITVSNIGTAPTTGPVTFTLSIPASVTAPATFVSNGFTCSTSGTLVSCTSSATIAANASTAVSLTITPLPSAAGTSPVLSATVTAANESNPNNNTATTTVTPAVVAPDLTIAIGQPSPLLLINQPSNLPILVSNIGTAPTSGPTTFTLSIPSSINAPATFTNNGFSCTTSGTLVACSSPNAIANGTTTTVQVPITPNTAAINPVLSATVAAANESNPNNNTATTTVSTVAAPDLTVSIGQPVPVLVAGKTSSVPVTINNIGSAATTGATTFTLSIPASVTAPATFTSNGFSCTTSGTLVSCTGSAAIAGGASSTLTVPITPLNAAVGTSPVLSATVATAFESNVNNNTATTTVTTPVAGQPDLIVAVGQPAPVLSVGQTSSVPVSLSNIGTAATSGPVTFTLSIPASVTAPATFVSNGFSCSTSGTLVACSSPVAITNGASTTVLVPITPLAAAAGTSPVLSATAATGNESNPNNNTTTTTVTSAVVAPDLTVSIGQPAPVLVAGQSSSVPVTINNIGTAATSGPVTFTLSIPASVTAPATFVSNGFTCSTSGTLVSCTSSAIITNGAGSTLAIPITPLNAAVGTSPALSATVATAFESNVNNNTATVTATPVAGQPDLIVAVGQPAPVLSVGQTSSVPVSLSNIGTAATSGPVTFTLSIPSSVTAPATFVSNGFSCSTSGTLVSCSSPVAITNGASTTVLVPITPLVAAAGTSLVLSATAATGNESNPNNNTTTTTVAPAVVAPDLIVSIGQPAPVLVAGQSSSVPVTFNNIGTAPTTGPVTFTLSIPASVTAPATFTSNGFSCATSGTLVSCTSSATITNGAGSTLAIPITPLNAAVGTSPVLSGTVATAFESNVNNNTATVTATPVAGQPDLIVAVGQPAPVLSVGQTSSVPVSLSNIGTAATSGPVTFTLSIPASVTAPATFVSNGFSCSTSGTLVACSSPVAITNGASTTVLVPITPLAAAAGTSPVLSATAATGNESNPNNNTTTTTVAPAVVAPDLTVAIGQPAPVLVAGQSSNVPVAIRNIGTAPTTGPVTFTLSIPASVTAPATFVSNGFTCSTSGTLVSCTSSATITNGAGTTVLVPVTALSGAAGTSPVLSATVAGANESNVNNNTATTTVAVSASVVAAPDAGTVSAGTGGIAVANIAANDVVNGAPATLGTGGNATVASLGTYPAGLTLNPATGSISVAVGTTPGSYTLIYQLCDRLSSPTCAITTATITVTASVTAAPDAGTVSTGTGGAAIPNIATNDVVNGQPATLGTGGNATVATIGTYPAGITLNPATGSVSVAVGTVPGTYTLAYQLCDRLTTPTCATTTATITVTPSVTAIADAGSAGAAGGGVAVPNVVANDIVNGVPATLGTGGNATLALVSVSPAGITLDPATGSVSVAQGTTPGTYTLVYQVCDRLTTPTCATAAVTVSVGAGSTAGPDSGTAPVTGGVANPSVVANDFVNGQPATLGAGGNATVATIGTYPAGITLDPATGSVSVTAGTAPGSYTVAYQLCDKLTTPNCTTGLVTLTVRPVVTAGPDAGTVSTGTGGTAVTSIVANDVVNSFSATLGTGGNATVATIGTYPAGINLNIITGQVSVAAGTVPGTYTLAYQLCDRLATPTCATGLVTITVTPSVTAAADAGTVSAGTGGIAVVNVTANDVINTLPATLGAGGNATVASVGTFPAGITFDPATGSISVAVGTAPDSYTVAYQLCDRLATPTCATTTAVITVTPGVTAAPDAGTVSAGTGGTAVANVTTNDIVNGQPATLGAGGNATVATIGTYPAGITLNPATGSVSVAVGTMPGSYAIAYQLCDRLATPTCATTTVTISVTASLVGNPDAGAAPAGGGTAIPNVTANDMVNGQPATLGAGGNATVAGTGNNPAGISVDPATGAVNVAAGTVPGSYTVTYQICDRLTPATCATGVATITVTPSVTASPDAGTVSAGSGGTAVANVTTNDIVNGQPATLGTGGNATVATIGTYPSGITLNPATGSVSVTAGTIPGTYTLVYQLCDRLATPTCATTTATITVTPSLTAAPDAGTVSSGTGGTPVLNIAANDRVNGVAATLGTGGNATVAQVGTYPAGITLNPATGSVSVAVGTMPGSYTVAYQLCDKLTTPTCTTGLAAITVTPSLTATPDAGTAPASGGTIVANVAANDIVNGQPALLGPAGNATLAALGTYPAGVTLNPATGSVSVAAGTVPGSYTVAYQLCDRLTTPTCTTGLLSLTITPTVVANPDAGAEGAASGGVVVANVAANDLINGLPATLGTGGNATVAQVGTYPPGITFNPATGSVSLAIGTTPGSYTVAYQLCDRLTPTTCATTTVTVMVLSGSTATPDAGTVSAGTGGVVIPNVASNDVVNGQSVILGTGGNATVAQVGTYPPGITLTPATGSVSVTVGTAPGTYTVVYQLCDRLATPTCTTGVATITVTPSVVANPDAGTVSAGAGGVAVPNIAANDVVNGQPATVGTGGNATVAQVGTYPAGITLNPATGSVSVAVGTIPGDYFLMYQLCDRLTPQTCTTGMATITVTRSLTGVADAGTAPAGGGVALANVAANDIVNGRPATLGVGGNATVAQTGTYPAGITLDPATGSLNVATGTAPGSYTIAYQLCDRITPITCTTGLLTITVTPSLTATPDAGTVSSGTGGTAVANVTTNDVVNGRPATLGTGGNATVAQVGTYPAGITLNPATGSVSVAVGTAPGSYTVAYQLCDRLTTPTCATTAVTITVTPSLTAAPDAGTVSAGTGGTAVASVVTNDVVNGRPATLGAGGNATVAALGTFPAGVVLDQTTGALTVAPNTVPGSFTLAYQLCDKLTPTTCTTATIALTITSSLTARPDAATLVGGATVTIPILANDSNPDGSPVTGLTFVSLSIGTAPTKGTITVNPNGTVSYSANIGGTGTDSFVYSLCDRANPGTCTSATVTVNLSPNRSVVLAPKVYLQGALFGVGAGNPLMRDDLRAKGLVPLTSPYPALGLNGLTPVGPVSPSVLSTTGTNAIVDWVFVELRSSTDPTVVVDSRPALVQRDGDIVEVDGVSSLSFNVAQSGGFYVGVRHRNHLGVLTAQAVPLSFSTTVVDFRTSSTATYNLNANSAVNQPQVVVDQGVALWAGNALFDNNVIYQGPGNDVNVIAQQVINAPGNLFVSPSYKLRGYYSGDINLNGEVIFQGSGNDVDFIYQNIIKNHPGNTLKQNFFKIKEQLP